MSGWRSAFTTRTRSYGDQCIERASPGAGVPDRRSGSASFHATYALTNTANIPGGALASKFSKLSLVFFSTWCAMRAMDSGTMPLSPASSIAVATTAAASVSGAAAYSKLNASKVAVTSSPSGPPPPPPAFDSARGNTQSAWSCSPRNRTATHPGISASRRATSPSLASSYRLRT
eukprot:31268-Pelagococcus_subviridis.AAC.7